MGSGLDKTVTRRGRQKQTLTLRSKRPGLACGRTTSRTSSGSTHVPLFLWDRPEKEKEEATVPLSIRVLPHKRTRSGAKDTQGKASVLGNCDQRMPQPTASIA